MARVSGKRRGAPSFVDVSDRQLGEALAVIRLEMVSRARDVPQEDVSPEELRLLAESRLHAALDYVARRLPQLLGFPTTKGAAPGDGAA